MSNVIDEKIAAMKYLNAIEKVIGKIENDEGQNITANYLKDLVSEDLREFAADFKLTEMEAIFFCQIFYLAISGTRINYVQIKNGLKLSVFEFIANKFAIEALLKKRLCFKGGNDYGESYLNIGSEVYEGLINGEVKVEVHKKVEDIYDFADACMIVFRNRDSRKITQDELFEELDGIIKINHELSCVKLINSFNLEMEDKIILLFLMCKRAELYEEVEVSDLSSCIYDRLKERGRIQTMFINGTSALTKKELIVNVEGEYAVGNCIKISDALYIDLFGTELANMNRRSRLPKTCKFIKHSAILPQQLYYNEGTQIAINTIKDLFSEDKYQDVRNRLKSNNLRVGFTMVFYGGPGTGKTETIYQLCREAERDIMMIDISTIKNKYVGESEKNLKAVFKEYNYIVKNQKKCPVLFLNEADALISKRIDINTSVDQMSNSMQNILLQELEDFEGILCATTNLLDNIDAAFERRFLYKMKFEKPGTNERAKIWQSKFKNISKRDALDLANQFDLSGAEIENVARKMQIENVLFDKAVGLDNLIGYCMDERYRNVNSQCKLPIIGLFKSRHFY